MHFYKVEEHVICIYITLKKNKGATKTVFRVIFTNKIQALLTGDVLFIKLGGLPYSTYILHENSDSVIIYHQL